MSTNLYYNRNSLPNSQWSLKHTRSGLSTSSDQGSNVFKNSNRRIRTSTTAFSSATQTNGGRTYPKISSTSSRHSTAHYFPTSMAPCGSVQAPILPFLCHNHYGFCSLCQNFPETSDVNTLHNHLLRMSYTWPNAKQDITDHLQTCNLCQNRTSTPATTLSANEKVTCDIFGPFPSYSDHKFLLVIQDQDTLFTEYVPLTSNDPATIARAIITKWIAKLTVPRLLVTKLNDEQITELRLHLESLLGPLDNLRIAKSNSKQCLASETSLIPLQIGRASCRE